MFIRFIIIIITIWAIFQFLLIFGIEYSISVEEIENSEPKFSICNTYKGFYVSINNLSEYQQINILSKYEDNLNGTYFLVEMNFINNDKSKILCYSKDRSIFNQTIQGKNEFRGRILSIPEEIKDQFSFLGCFNFIIDLDESYDYSNLIIVIIAFLFCFYLLYLIIIRTAIRKNY